MAAVGFGACGIAETVVFLFGLSGVPGRRVVRVLVVMRGDGWKVSVRGFRARG